MTDDQPRFDPSGPGLVWLAVADDIAGQIESGKLRPGARLPSELALAETYGCARMTVHRAIRDLRERGLVTVTVGKGTFVAGGG
jgi:DNA-binding GntR family transcriptional regulator